MKRRLFSILLALCMTLAMLPAAAFAKSVSYNGEIIIENNRWEFADDETVGYYVPGKSGKFKANRPDSDPYLKVTKTGENEITITVHGNVTLQGKKALSANDENAIKSIKNLIITGATTGENSLSLSTTTDGTAISVLGDFTVTGIALTATADNGPALRANNITVSDATLIATNNSADSAAIQAMQGDGPLGNLTVSGTSAITVTNKNATGRAIHATIINGNTDGRTLTVNGNETPGQTDASQVTVSSSAPHSHICSDGWTSDATGHWHRCADANCTEKLNFAAHTGGTATCTEAKKCEVCGEPYGELDPSNHTALSDWTSNETGHWKACADCKAADIDKAIHAYSDWIIDKEPTVAEAGAKCRECSVCHYKETATIHPVPCTHEGSTSWEPANDGVHHVKKCAACGAIIEKAAHSGGTTTCSAKKKCTICGQSYGELDPSNHTALSGWTSNETHHWKTCSACSTDIEKAAHTFGEWIIDKEATATEAGSRHKVCTICNYETQTETIPATCPCTHEGSTWEPADDGVHHVKKCADCGAIIEKTAHSGGTATCTAKKKCEICNQSYGELDPSNHTALSDWASDETHHWKTCKDCKTDIEKAAHTGGAATCTEAKKCEVCGQSYGEPSPSNHTALSGWKFDEAGHWKTCSACSTDIEKTAHTYSEWQITQKATTAEAGAKCRECSVCHYKETATIPPVPCTHEGSTIWKPADDGVHHVKKCTNCGAEPAIEKHNFSYRDNGDNSHTMTCNICGETCIEPHNFSHKTVPVNDGKHRGQCVCGAFDAAEEHTFENGICTACGAAAPALVEPTPGGSGIIITPEAADPVFLSGANQTVAVGGSAVFRIDYNYAAFRSVAVDGVTLTPADYTTWEGSTWVKLTPAYVKTLGIGTHTLSVYFDGAAAATTFTVGGQPNPATGARDAVGIAAAAAVIALLGSAAVLRKK